jgi:hypothetical protein
MPMSHTGHQRTCPATARRLDFARAIRCGDAPNCQVTRRRKNERATLAFEEGSCVLLDWRRIPR